MANITNDDLTIITLNSNANTQSMGRTFRPQRPTIPITPVVTLSTPQTISAGQLPGETVTGVINDTNVTGAIDAQTLVLGWTGTLAAGRLNSNVVQNVTPDANVIGTISLQTLSLSWAGTLSLSRGGTAANLSATGGTSHVLKQVSTGAAISVGQLAASDLSNGTTGSGSVVLATAPSVTTILLTAATPSTSSGQVGLGTTTGFGNGSSSTAMTTTTKSTGTGPTTPQTIVSYLEISIGGSTFWIPLVQ